MRRATNRIVAQGGGGASVELLPLQEQEVGRMVFPADRTSGKYKTMPLVRASLACPSLEHERPPFIFMGCTSLEAQGSAASTLEDDLWKSRSAARQVRESRAWHAACRPARLDHFESKRRDRRSMRS